MVSQGGGNVRLSVLSVQCEARRSGARKRKVDLFPRLEYVVRDKMEFCSSFGGKNSGICGLGLALDLGEARLQCFVTSSRRCYFIKSSRSQISIKVV